MKCPSCPRTKPRNFYLCRTCWFQLPQAARTALNRRDDEAGARLIDLYHQLNRGVPLADIKVAP